MYDLACHYYAWCVMTNMMVACHCYALMSFMTIRRVD